MTAVLAFIAVVIAVPVLATCIAVLHANRPPRP